ncbi:DUF397 domain-containing protein [Micromonospora sp. NPDC049101]|uniref:DUF397 domain-containing protein n=1 Tax=Micromonospora sp. NPDC049101 TaxID=3155032 RepID=UPI0033EC2B3E
MDMTNAQWRKSSRSGTNGGNCVEVADNLPGVVAIRDSKDQQGPALLINPGSFSAFLRGAKGAGFTA